MLLPVSLIRDSHLDFQDEGFVLEAVPLAALNDNVQVSGDALDTPPAVREELKGEVKRLAWLLGGAVVRDPDAETLTRQEAGRRLKVGADGRFFARENRWRSVH